MNAAAGGAALSTLSLATALKPFGIAACAVCHDAGTPEERSAVEDAFEGEALFTPLYWWNRKVRAARWKRPLLEVRQQLTTYGQFKSTSVVAQAARRFGAELIHTNTILTPEGGRAARALGLPHVWHVRELTGPQAPFQLPLKGQKLRDFTLRHASVLVANSEASAQPWREVVPADRLFVVPNGIELERFDSSLRPTRRPIVAMVANLTSRTKRHQLFIEAMGTVKPHVDARIYGQRGPATDAYDRQMAQLASEHGVQLMGFVEAPTVMRDIDVLVQPAENESFGRTVVEAMASGLPVVGARGGGVGEIIVEGQTGLTFAPGDGAGLAHAVRRLVDDEALRRKLGATAERHARARYSVEAYARGVAAAYAAALPLPLRPTWEALAAAASVR